MSFSVNNDIDGTFNNRGDLKDAGRGGIRGPYAAEALTEMRMHAENVHHPDSVAERERRVKAKRYEAMKAEMQRLRPKPSSGSAT